MLKFNLYLDPKFKVIISKYIYNYRLYIKLNIILIINLKVFTWSNIT